MMFRSPTHRTRTRRSRAGASLIEMLVVSTLLTFLLGSVVTALYHLQRLDRKVRNELAANRALMQLGQRWRTDVHAARRAELTRSTQPPKHRSELAPDHRNELVLETASANRLTYHQIPRRVIRTVYAGDQVAHRDAFLIPELTQVQWELTPAESGEDAAHCVLVVERESHALRLRAAVGLDRRLTGSGD